MLPAAGEAIFYRDASSGSSIVSTPHTPLAGPGHAASAGEPFMLVSSSTPSCRLETLEPRRLLSAAASAGVALEVGLVREMLDADVSAARSATRAAYWRETGALDADALPAGATLDAVAGRTFDFSLDRFAAALPKGTRAAAR